MRKLIKEPQGSASGMDSLRHEAQEFRLHSALQPQIVGRSQDTAHTELVPQADYLFQQGYHAGVRKLNPAHRRYEV